MKTIIDLSQKEISVVCGGMSKHIKDSSALEMSPGIGVVAILTIASLVSWALFTNMKMILSLENRLVLLGKEVIRLLP
jgi:hypothetical protein